MDTELTRYNFMFRSIACSKKSCETIQHGCSLTHFQMHTNNRHFSRDKIVALLSCEDVGPMTIFLNGCRFFFAAYLTLRR